MLEEVETATRTHHTSQFSECRSHVGNRAQRERAQGTVTGVVGERDLLPVETDVFHPHTAGDDARFGQSAGDVGRLDGVHDVDFIGVGRHVQAGAKADLHDSPEEAGRHLAAPCVQFRRTAGAIDDPRKDSLAVDTHARHGTRGLNSDSDSHGDDVLYGEREISRLEELHGVRPTRAPQVGGPGRRFHRRIGERCRLRGSATHVRALVGDQEMQIDVLNDGSTWIPAPGTPAGIGTPAEAIRLLDHDGWKPAV